MALLFRFIRELGCALLVVSITAATATAAPVTVNLRVEGSTQTFFDGPVTTDARNLVTPSDPSPGHPCDVADNGPTPPGGGTAGTPTTALADAAAASGLAFDAQWFGSTPFGDVNDYFVNQVGADVNQNSGSFASWGLAVNYTPVSTGGCQIAVTPGMDVLWAYDFFNKTHLLKLGGPSVANVGESVVVRVVDGQDNSPVADASVRGSQGSAATDSNGYVATTFGAAGVYALKADKADSVRSNTLLICVHNGDDGTCGTTKATQPATAPAQQPANLPPSSTALDRTPPQGVIEGISEGHVFARGGGPRTLHGLAGDPSGLSAVRLRLTRSDRGRCSYYNGTSEKLRRSS